MVTDTIEVEPSLEIGQTPPLTEQLAHISGMDSPNDQFIALDRNSIYTGCLMPDTLTAADVDALIDFVADPSSSPSLIVRAQALDNAVRAIHYAHRSPHSEELLPVKKDLYDLIPKSLIDTQHYIQTAQSESSDVRYFTRQLAEKEGISFDIMAPDWHEYSNDPLAMPDSIPTTAMLLLKHLSAIDERVHKIPVSNFAKLIPLALDIKTAIDPENEKISVESQKQFATEANEISKFLSHEVDDTKPYIAELNMLRLNASKLMYVFPEAYTYGIETGAQTLFANCLYAVRAHLDNDKITYAKVPLNGSAEQGLELNLGEDEPLQILRQLNTAISQLYDIVYSPDFNTTLVAKSQEFSLYRLWDTNWVTGDTEEKSMVSVYIRPEGAETYDQNLEYGRNGEGVEASISFVIDTAVKEGEVLEVGKHRGNQPDNRLSIRLDREGVAPQDRTKKHIQRDPTKFQGTLSLDIGSVIGDENWFGTKVGRLLAWGNLLRCEANGQQTQLNHSTQYFMPADGRADYFSEDAKRLRADYAGKQLTRKEVAQRFSGFYAIRGL